MTRRTLLPLVVCLTLAARASSIVLWATIRTCSSRRSWNRTRSDCQWSLFNLGSTVEVLASRPGDVPVTIGASVGQG